MTRWIVTGVALWLTGCTFIDQKVQIAPQVDVAQAEIGHQKQIPLNVLDERENPVIGKRGTGMVAGAKITTSQDVVELFSNAIKQGLRQKGFEPIPFEDGRPTDLRVEIRTLDYDVSMGLWTGSNLAKASIKVLAHNAGKTYEKVYRGQGEIRTMWVASQETNAKIINAAVSEVLNKMFADQELLAFLAR